MGRLPTLTAAEAEALLLRAGFVLSRTKGSHRIYVRGSTRVVIPFHGGRSLHPKISQQVHRALDTAP